MKVDPLGLTSAFLLLALALRKDLSWWMMNFGDLAFLGFSPFKVYIRVINVDLVPPIVEYLTLAACITIMAGALLMGLDSLTTKGWSKSLISFGLSKIASVVVATIVLAIIPYIVLGPASGTVTAMVPSGLSFLEVKFPILIGEGFVKLQPAISGDLNI